MTEPQNTVLDGQALERRLEECSGLTSSSLFDMHERDKVRMVILLRAAYDLLTRNDQTAYVQEACYTLAQYDNTNCDGYCLKAEIAEIIGIDENTAPKQLVKEDY